jgi:D-glycero-D-manno-heptose 1,7-bisphosphate phosphatase
VRPAVFLDRDGTLIEHVHHLRLADDVSLVAGAAGAVSALARAGYACVVVTNQSALGRGLLDEAELGRIHQRMAALLGEGGARLDGVYFSSHVPKTNDQSVIEHPDRKPGPGLLKRAASDLGLDLGRSYMVGDSLSDLLAGQNAGCRESLLVLTGLGAETNRREAGRFRTAASLVEAAQMILCESKGVPQQ